MVYFRNTCLESSIWRLYERWALRKKKFRALITGLLQRWKTNLRWERIRGPSERHQSSCQPAAYVYVTHGNGNISLAVSLFGLFSHDYNNSGTKPIPSRVLYKCAELIPNFLIYPKRSIANETRYKVQVSRCNDNLPAVLCLLPCYGTSKTLLTCRAESLILALNQTGTFAGLSLKLAQVVLISSIKRNTTSNTPKTLNTRPQ